MHYNGYCNIHIQPLWSSYRTWGWLVTSNIYTKKYITYDVRQVLDIDRQDLSFQKSSLHMIHKQERNLEHTLSYSILSRHIKKYITYDMKQFWTLMDSRLSFQKSSLQQSLLQTIDKQERNLNILCLVPYYPYIYKNIFDWIRK